MSATTFLVTDIMENSAPDRIMESAIAANVLAIHSGIAQVLLLLKIIIIGIGHKVNLKILVQSLSY